MAKAEMGRSWMERSWNRLAHAGFLGVALCATAARAEEPYDPQTGVPSDTSLAKGQLKDWRVVNDARAALAQRGVYFQTIYNADLLANVSGGLKRGGNYAGRLELTADIALGRLFGAGAAGGFFAEDRIHINAFAIQGAGITSKYVGSLAAISNIEATPTFRLFEAWYEHNGGPWSLRLGQLGVDSEHATSATAGQFNDGTFGWPVLAASNLPSGGGAYPLATPAARLKYSAPSKAFEWQVAVFNGDPARPGEGSPQTRNRHGVDFRLRGGAYFVSELKIAVPGLEDASVKIGGWRHSGRFDDQRWDIHGAPRAVSGESARRRRGDYGVYGGLDTQVPGIEGVSFFLRGFAAPGERNLVSRQVDVGLVRKGVFFDKDKDAFGLAASVARISSGARDYDADAIAAGLQSVKRSYEAVIEANYSVQVTDGWVLQPNLQYVVHPGGRIADPNDPTGQRTLKNATVLTLRSQWKF